MANLSRLFTAFVLIVALASAAAPDRALVAVRTGEREAFASWRAFAADEAGLEFTLEVSSEMSGPFRAARASGEATNRRVELPEGDAYLRLAVAMRGGPSAYSKTVTVPARISPYLAVPLGSAEIAQKVGFGDFDGDGSLDYLVKTPAFNVDPYHMPGYWKKSPETYKLTAYRSDGTRLWTYDMGWSIETGIWYSPVVVCDLDGDGRAEVFCKAGEGDPREAGGKVTAGPEWLVMLDGRTGEVRKRQPWPSREGYPNYNYASRNLLGVAWLDGKRPHIFAVRGTYNLMKVHAFSPEFEPLWRWETPEGSDFRGQGMHGLHAADIDGDGKDEIILGGSALDDDGTPLWTTKKGHPDVCYVADIDPARPGLEIFYGIEVPSSRGGVALHDARTGKEIWAWEKPTIHVHSQGMVGDIIPERPGLECYAGEAKGGAGWWLYSGAGELINRESLGELDPKAIYWLEGPTKIYVAQNKMYRWPREQVGAIPEGRIVAIADFLGDWREEMIVATAGALRIYTTTVPTALTRAWLMEDRLYRNDVMLQTMGYFYPPQLTKW